MIKEPKNIDFVTSGRQPSEADFARISDWIKQHKEKQAKKRIPARQRKSVLPRSM